ncbi:MAG TPA: hypothetical protein VJ841_05230 [Candidatus Saccharimonadales bacterium]|nr:hypothetical protein [Candidatus Saccharimonadales bacterium]
MRVCGNGSRSMWQNARAQIPQRVIQVVDRSRTALQGDDLFGEPYAELALFGKLEYGGSKCCLVQLVAASCFGKDRTHGSSLGCGLWPSFSIAVFTFYA